MSCRYFLEQRDGCSFKQPGVMYAYVCRQMEEGKRNDRGPQLDLRWN